MRRRRGKGRWLLSLLLATVLIAALLVVPRAETGDASEAAETDAAVQETVDAQGEPQESADAQNEPQESADAQSEPQETADAQNEPQETDDAQEETPESTDAQVSPDTQEEASETPVKTEYVYEDSEKTVTATLENPASLPDGAVLCVRAITPSESPEQYAELSDMVSGGSDLGSLDESRFEFCAYVIYFLYDGQEIEPVDGSVNVSISYKQPVFESSGDSIAVYHVEGDGSNAVLTSVDASASVTSSGTLSAVEFDTDSFSVYLVTNGYTMSSSLTYRLIDTTSETFTNTIYYNPNCVLGIAGNFHIVAFGTAHLNTHTNGNVLAKNLYAGSNFGTSNLTNELSYIQNYLQVSSNSASSTSHVLAVGSSATVALTDNGNAFSVNGTKIDSPKTIYQDSSTSTLPFINLTTVKSEVSGISSMIAGYPAANIDSSHLSTSGGSCDASYLSLTSPNGIGVYSISGSALSSYSYMGIKGFTSGSDGSVLINVNCSGLTTVNMPIALIYIDGVTQSTNETTTYENGKVIWNFINATGVTITSKQMTGTIIALGATVNISQNLNGTVIAENVNVNAESHRTDFTGKITDNVSVKKVWTDKNGNTLSGSAISCMSVTVKLYDNGTAMTGSAYTAVLNAANNWSYTWTGLPSTGHSYTVREVSIYNGSTTVTVTTNASGVSTATGYTITYANNSGIVSGTVTITNKITDSTVTKTVTKVWNDNNNQAGLRPSSITVQLKANGCNYGSAVTLSAANNWTYTWSDLPAKDCGSTITYTVAETSTVNEYTTTYSADTFTITNTLIYYQFHVLKVSSESSQEVLSGASFKLEKLTNAGTVDPTFTAITGTTGSNGILSFSNLTAGKYRLTETAAPAGYVNAGTVITFTLNSCGVTVVSDSEISTLCCENTTEIVVKNEPGFLLPETGGTGTAPYVIAGLVLVATAAGLLIHYLNSKRKT